MENDLPETGYDFYDKLLSYLCTETINLSCNLLIENDKLFYRFLNFENNVYVIVNILNHRSYYRELILTGDLFRFFFYFVQKH